MVYDQTYALLQRNKRRPNKTNWEAIKNNCSLSCKMCEEPIKFDDKHISERTVKKIPLDRKTNEPHDCPMWNVVRENLVPLTELNSEQPQQTQQRRCYHCNKGCGQEIYFDANNKSQSGKWIPLDKDTGLSHQYQKVLEIYWNSRLIY
jgi:hypothetical protein